VVHLPTFPAQKNVDSAVAVPYSSLRNLMNPFPKSDCVISNAQVPMA